MRIGEQHRSACQPEEAWGCIALGEAAPAFAVVTSASIQQSEGLNSSARLAVPQRLGAAHLVQRYRYCPRSAFGVHRPSNGEKVFNFQTIEWPRYMNGISARPGWARRWSSCSQKTGRSGCMGRCSMWIKMPDNSKRFRVFACVVVVCGV